MPNSSSNTVVVLAAIGMLTAHITDVHQLVIDCFELILFFVFLLLAAAIVVGIIITVLCLIIISSYYKKRKMTCSQQNNKVLSVSILFLGCTVVSLIPIFTVSIH